jgi:hypothetical protein
MIIDGGCPRVASISSTVLMRWSVFKTSCFCSS